MLSRALIVSRDYNTYCSFSLAYFEAGAEKETLLHDVPASAVRIPAGQGGAWPPPPEEEPLPPPPPPDENTGLGGWQTVSTPSLLKREEGGRVVSGFPHCCEGCWDDGAWWIGHVKTKIFDRL